MDFIDPVLLAAVAGLCLLAEVVLMELGKLVYFLIALPCSLHTLNVRQSSWVPLLPKKQSYIRFLLLVDFVGGCIDVLIDEG